MVLACASRPAEPCRLAATLALFALGGSICAEVVFAQAVSPMTPIASLPRPGYEQRGVRIGAATLTLDLDTAAAYDSNVYATNTDTDADAVIDVAPTARLGYDGGAYSVQADTFARFRFHGENTQEDTQTFGLGAAARYELNAANLIDGQARYERAFERRTDPEADADLSRPPTDIDVLSGEIGYRYLPARFGIGARLGVISTNYLSAEDADRDLASYRASLRGIVRVTPRINGFVEGFGNWRDSRTAVDRQGIDRDATTWGVNAGTSISIENRLTGEIAAGVFRAEPGDPSLEPFTGFGANGRLTWQPRTRTAITVSVFRGDVATIRGGASGRIDSSASLRIDQEVRHNLLMNAAVGIESVTYRGAADREQTSYSASLGAEYLLNRHASLTADVSHVDRRADFAADAFKRTVAAIGLRLKF